MNTINKEIEITQQAQHDVRELVDKYYYLDKSVSGAIRLALSGLYKHEIYLRRKSKEL